MRIEDEKLEQFANDIMADVALKRQKILAGVDKEIDKEYKAKESILYTEAYEKIQNGLKVIDLEKHEIVAKALMENKQELLHTRNAIIDDVFDTVRNRLRAFIETDDYKKMLFEMIEENIKALESENPEVILNYTDEKLAKEVTEKFGCQVICETKQLDFIGGCKVIDKEKQLYIDDSFEGRLDDGKEDFLLDCKIVID